MKNRYKVKYAYTLEEMLLAGIYVNNGVLDRVALDDYCPEWTCPDETVIPTTYFDNGSMYTSLLGLIYQRHLTDVTIISEEEWDGTIENYSYTGDIFNQTERWVQKFFNILMMTHLRYETLLGFYDAQKENLLDKLEKTYEGEIDNTGTQGIVGTNTGTQTIGVDSTHFRKENDTPQGSGDFTDDSHVSAIVDETDADDTLRTDNLANSSTRTDNLKTETSYTETWDTMPIIEKLKEVEDNFHNVMMSWVKEFDGLFMEDANIHEY